LLRSCPPVLVEWARRSRRSGELLDPIFPGAEVEQASAAPPPSGRACSKTHVYPSTDWPSRWRQLFPLAGFGIPESPLQDGQNFAIPLCVQGVLNPLWQAPKAKSAPFFSKVH